MKSRSILVLLITLALFGCSPGSDEKTLRFAISADYPPFEYKVNGELQGFDIDLAKLVAKELGREATFIDMQFSTILPALENGHVDAAISTIAVTQERKQHFDFSQIYYKDGIVAVYKENQAIHSKEELKGKKIACQLGSTMEIWAKKNGFGAQLMVMDNNTQAIEALKANHAEVVLMDGVQGHVFSQKNPKLAFHILAQSEDGYAIGMRKGSPQLAEINAAIAHLKKNGEIAKLEEKWLKGDLP